MPSFFRGLQHFKPCFPDCLQGFRPDFGATSAQVSKTGFAGTGSDGRETEVFALAGPVKW